MRLRYILILFILFLSFRGTAQPSETIYLGNVAQSGYADNNSFGPFNIGFTFTFFGNTYTQFYVSSNGLVTFGTGSSDNSEDPIPTAGTPNNYIAPFWDDLVVDPFGNILYTTIGAAPNRKLVIQFRNIAFYNTPIYLGTFSAILYENINKIQIQYRTIVIKDNSRATGGSATIGIENIDGTSGVQYSYQTPSVVSSGKAISFTPSGMTYNMNPDEIYDGIYLTTNTTLPEPGITEMITPINDATVGVDLIFEWAATTNVSNYSIELSTNSSLVGATSYNAGLNLTYSLSGLIPDTTYYWTVFTSNATGYTWNEVRSFRTSSTPPLNAVPRTIWVEQSQEKTIQLQYTGGDASAKTAIVTSLPAQGQLYQYNAGAKGALISSVPATVTDANRNVIYLANGTTGNGAGNFSFKIHDNTGDSPDALVTVNVSPPGIPNLLYVAKSTNVELQFDRPMADPTGKQSQFAITVNSSPATINSLSLKTGDPYSIIFTLNTPLTGTETVLISYTAGDVASVQGGWLLSFTDQSVILTAQTITFSQSLSKKYSDSPLTLTATASSGLGMTYSSSNMGVATASSNVLTFHALGTSDITARQLGNGTYAPARYIKTLTVIKGDQIITFNAFPVKTYGDANFSPGATASSGLTVSYSSDNSGVATIVGSMIHIVGTGTAVITASQAGNTLWNPAISVPQTLNVNKANQTITFSVLPAKTYDDPDYSLSASASSGLSVTYVSSNSAVATVAGNTVHIVGAGTTTITASQTGNSNYNPAPDVPQTLTVNKADQTITFSVLPTKTYGDADFVLSASASSGLSVSYTSSNPAVATVTGNLVHIVGAGATTITASQAGNSNYNPAPAVPQTFTIYKADQTITFSALPEKNYGDADFVLSATASSGLSVSFTSDNLSVATVTGNTVHIVGTGTAVITASQTGNANYNPAPDVHQTLTVNKMAQTITFTDYPDSLLVQDSYTLAATSSAGLTVLFESGDDNIATVSGNQLTGVGKGSVQIRAYNDGDVDYESAEAFVTVVVYSTHRDIMYLFTPNNDGFNDLWELPEMSTWGNCDVKVYNRWGKLVYDNKNYNNTWDGTSGGKPVPEGPYYFVIKTENTGVVKGTVNIVR